MLIRKDKLNGNFFASYFIFISRQSARFLPVKINYTVEKHIEIYIIEFIRLHGLLSNIVSNREPKLTSHFRKSLHEPLGEKLWLTSTYHPQSDGKIERTIQSLEDLLKVCVLDNRGKWDDLLPMIEFTYNNSFHSSIVMAPYKALYVRKCQTILFWYQNG